MSDQNEKVSVQEMIAALCRAEEANIAVSYLDGWPANPRSTPCANGSGKLRDGIERIIERMCYAGVGAAEARDLAISVRDDLADLLVAKERK